MYLENTAIFLQALDDNLTDGDPSDGLQTNAVSDSPAAFADGINISQTTRDAFADYEVDANGRAAAPGTGQPLNLANSGKVMIQDALAHVGIDFTRVTEADPDGGSDGNFENVFETIAMQHVQDTVETLTDGTARDTDVFDARLEDVIDAGDGVITYFSNTIDVNDPASNQIEFDASSLLANATPQQVANTANMEIELTDDIGAHVTIDGVKTQVGEVVYDAATRTGAIEFDPNAITNEQIAAGALDTLEFEYRIWDWTANTVVKVEPLDLYKAKIIPTVEDVPESSQYNQFSITHSLVGDLQREDGSFFQADVFTNGQELTVRFSPEGLAPFIAEYGDDFTVPVEYSTDSGSTWQPLQTVGTWLSPGSTLPLPEFGFTWPANTATIEFRIPLFDDLADEPGPAWTGPDYADLIGQGIESIDITMGGNDNFFTKNLQPGIIDNDPTENDLPVIGIDFVIVSEGDGEAVFTVSLSGDDPDRSSDITVDYSMADLSATAGADYTAVSGTLTFAPGVSTQTITVPIIDDLLIESPNPEFALVDLSNPTNAVLGDAQGTLRIFDNDGPTVYEAGLPEGSNPEPTAIVTGGDLDLSDFDDINIQTVRVDGQDVTGGGTINTPFGQLVISEDNGSYSWTYTLQNRGEHDQAPGNVNFEAFPVEIVGADNVVRDAGLFIVNIVDDTPTAVDDTNELPADDADGIIEGDVFANDTLGADRPAVITGVAVGDTDTPLDNAATVGAIIAGTYGNLVLASDGSYEYTRTAAPELGGDDVFTYTMVDEDGDVSTATLTIDADGDVVLNLPPEAGEGSASVDEAGLPAGSGELADGDAGNNSDTSETTTGTFTYSASDTPVDIVIGGVTVVENGVLTGNGPVDTGTGRLTITDFDPTTGTLDYSYELTTPVTDVDGVVETDSIEVTVSDDDGDSDTGYININIDDDVPTAADDPAELGSEVNSVNISPAFAFGADGPADTDSVTFTDGTYGTVSYDSGTGAFTYTVTDETVRTAGDSFTYTVEDADGDTVTRTISISSDSVPTVVVTYDTPNVGREAGLVDEDGLDDDGNNDDGETTTGTLTVTPGDDTPAELTIGGTEIPTDGSSVTINGSNGDLTISFNSGTGLFDWSYVLDTTVDHADGNGENIAQGVESFAVSIEDNDGSVANTTLTIDVQDDTPTSNPASASLDVPVSVVDVEDVDANWDDINPGSGIFIDNTGPLIRLRWGSGDDSSGYDFNINPEDPDIDQLFSLGTLTHLNFPVSGTTLDSVELDVAFDVVIDGVSTSVSTTILLDHDETPNNASPSNNPANDDFISITNPSGTAQTITVGDRTYEFRVAGFLDSSGNLVSSVRTVEGQSTSFSLRAEIQSTDDLPSIPGSVDGSLFGPDGPGAVALSWDNNGTEVTSGTITGTYGTLTANSDGSYSYTMSRTARDSVNIGQELTDSFTWYVTDSDGDRVASTLDIELTGVANSDTPIALDLDGDGVEYLSREAGVVFTDQVTGEAVNTAWVAGDDGLLVVDANNSGTVDEAREYVFTEWSETAQTDMEAVAEVFDTNQNQMLDAGDEAWSQFAVWQDANSDGITDAGELVSLDDLGVESIALTYHDESEATEAADGDVKIFGQSEVAWEDGEVTIAEDTSFAINVADLIPEADGAEGIDAYLQASFDGTNTIVQVSKSGGFTGEGGAAAQVDQTITFEGVDLVGGLEGSDAIQAMIDAGKLNVDQ